MKYNKAQNESEEDYFAFVEWLENETASSLQQAKGDVVAITAAITTYLETGYSAALSSGELVDFFCVSTPSVVDKAGYSEEEADAAIALYDEINPGIFARYYPENLQVKTMNYEAPPPPPPRPRPVPDNPQVSAMKNEEND